MSVERRAGRAAFLLVGAALALAGCGGAGTVPPGTPRPPAASTPAPTPAATPSVSPSSSPSTRPAAPAGTSYVPVPAAGILLPVPDGWETLAADALRDPAELERLAASYPGADRLVAAMEGLGGRAEPVFLAADPSAASLAAPIATNVSVMVAQPSTGGILLDLVAGFIADGLGDALGADADPDRTRVDLPAGEAVRLAYALPGEAGDVVGIAWVIGAPGGTLLVTLLGDVDAVAALEPDALAAAIELAP